LLFEILDATNETVYLQVYQSAGQRSTWTWETETKIKKNYNEKRFIKSLNSHISYDCFPGAEKILTDSLELPLS
jgi:hypothetical protein